MAFCAAECYSTVDRYWTVQNLIDSSPDAVRSRAASLQWTPIFPAYAHGHRSQWSAASTILFSISHDEQEGLTIYIRDDVWSISIGNLSQTRNDGDVHLKRRDQKRVPFV